METKIRELFIGKISSNVDLSNINFETETRDLKFETETWNLVDDAEICLKMFNNISSPLKLKSFRIFGIFPSSFSCLPTADENMLISINFTKPYRCSIQRFRAIGYRLRPVAFATGTRPEKVETESHKNGSRDSSPRPSLEMLLLRIMSFEIENKQAKYVNVTLGPIKFHLVCKNNCIGHNFGTCW